MAFETVLQIVQSVTGRMGIPRPNAVCTSNDPQVIQLLALANEEVGELGARYPWEILNCEAGFTTVAQEEQGSLSSICGGQQLGYVLNDTMWNRTQRINVPGPLTPSGWQALEALTSASSFWSRYRIRQDALLFYPAPAAGQQVFFEFQSESPVLSADEVSYQTEFLKDDDECLLNSRLVKLGLRWRWLKAKGLDYAEDFDTYENAVADATARDGTKPVCDMGRSSGLGGLRPVVVVPRANWNLN